MAKTLGDAAETLVHYIKRGIIAQGRTVTDDIACELDDCVAAFRETEKDVDAVHQALPSSRRPR